MKCKCKYPVLILINGIGVKCNRCHNWLTKIRKTFHKETQVAGKKKGYNRKEQKIQANKQIKER